MLSLKKIKRIVRNNIRPLTKLVLYTKFIRGYFNFRKLNKTNHRFSIKWKERWPCLFDNTANTDFDAHYIYHTAWAARVLKQTNPEKHIDLSSSLYFVSIVSAFIPVEFYDYRPAKLNLSGLKANAGDILNLPFQNNSIHSLSCMHVIEHIGLGRYGDPIDYDGDIKAILEIKRILAKGGNLLFVVPIGSKARIMYNAHRIYTYEQVCAMFSELELIDFSLIQDNYSEIQFISNPSREILQKQKYACGCFWFKKR